MLATRCYRTALFLLLLTLSAGGCGHLTDSCGPETRDVTASTSESTSGLSDYAQVMLTQDRGGPGWLYWFIQGPVLPLGEVDPYRTRNMSRPPGSSTPGPTWRCCWNCPFDSSRDVSGSAVTCRTRGRFRLTNCSPWSGPGEPCWTSQPTFQARNGCFGRSKRCSSEIGGGCHATDQRPRAGGSSGSCTTSRMRRRHQYMIVWLAGQPLGAGQNRSSPQLMRGP